MKAGQVGRLPEADKILLVDDDSSFRSEFKDAFNEYSIIEASSGDEALRLGVALEDNSVKFYKACRDRVSSEPAKKELGNIIEEEKRHKIWCEDMLARI